jgi:hypothetical protein
LGGARKLPRVEEDRGVGVNRIEVYVMKFRGRQHGSPSLAAGVFSDEPMSLQGNKGGAGYSEIYPAKPP